MSTVHQDKREQGKVNINKQMSPKHCPGKDYFETDMKFFQILR